MIGFPGTPRELPWRSARHAPVMGTRGVVASAHPLVSSAGARVLAGGGNAVDAAVAAALVASVTLPHMCGLGGDLFAIVHDPSRDGPLSYQGSGIAPRGFTYEMARAAGPGRNLMPEQGPLSTGVPGMVRGYRDLVANHGSRTFEELVQPALEYAGNGHPVAFDLADHAAADVELLSSYPSSKAIFLPGGRPPARGQLIKQADLAATFQRLIDAGLDDFYEGELAQRIAAGVQAVGGVLTAEDLATHETEITAPLSIEYRGFRINQTNLPSQGLIHLESHTIADRLLNPAEFFSNRWIHQQVETLKLAFADRLAYTQDPWTGASPVETLLSAEWANLRAREVCDQASTTVPAGRFNDGDTTYLAVIDGSGMMVSLIQSVSHAFGSGVVAGDTGVVMNNRVGRGFTLDPSHPNVYAPGKRTMHTLNCFSIESLDGTPLMVGGTPGGDGQPQWDLQMATAMIDGGLDVQQAVEMPRWTARPGTDPVTIGTPFELWLEPEFGEERYQQLAARGHSIKTKTGWHGAAQVIARDPETGVIVGGSDLRVEGQAIAL